MAEGGDESGWKQVSPAAIGGLKKPDGDLSCVGMCRDVCAFMIWHTHYEIIGLEDCALSALVTSASKK